MDLKFDIFSEVNNVGQACSLILVLFYDLKQQKFIVPRKMWDNNVTTLQNENFMNTLESANSTEVFIFLKRRIIREYFKLKQNLS